MIGLWKTSRAGMAVSHQKGLTKEQIDWLKTLKEGDRFVLWTNDKKKSPVSPDHTLKLSLEKVK